MRAGARSEEEGVNGIVKCLRSAMFPMVSGPAGDRQTIGLRFLPTRLRKRTNITVEDARVGFECFGADPPRRQLIQILRMERRQVRERSRGDVTILVIGTRIHLVRCIKPHERILISRCHWHCTGWTSINHIEHGFVERCMMGLRHGSNDTGDGRQDQCDLNPTYRSALASPRTCSRKKSPAGQQGGQ